jgi:ABC-type branched-subunit amino acid transport system ATPase component
MPLLEASSITKIFGKLTALDGAALVVAENEFHGLIGPNGSGKSTLMKCVAGAEMPTEGRVWFAGADITALSPTERARAGMSLKFQITSVLPSLTLYDNILLALQAQSSLLDLVLSRTRGCCMTRSWPCSPNSAWPIARTSRQRPCRTGSSNGWRSRWRWPPSRGSCFSTSRRAA